MHAQREGVAGGVDLCQQCRQLGSAVAHHVQHGAKYLAAQLAQAVQFNQRGQHVGALGAVGGVSMWRAASRAGR